MTLEEPHVDLATVPELAAILRARLRFEVRLFEAFCEHGDRLVDVLRVRGRPLAIARSVSSNGSMHQGHPERDRSWLGHREAVQGMWLDLPDLSYYSPSDPPPVGESRELRPLLLVPECAHQSAPVPGWWLHQQVEAGVRKRIIDAATRREMMVRPRGE